MKLKSRFLTVLTLLLAMAPACGNAFAAERVSMKSPAKDAAYVPVLQGMVNNRQLQSFLGTAHIADDGIVIRQSYVDGGKIVIPPGGLYVTSRSGNWEPFKGKPLTIAGKDYVAINNLYERTVIRDVTFKKNQIIPLDKNQTRGFELTSLEPLPYALPGQGKATFKLVKATGNYYGTEIPAYSGDLFTNIAGKNLAKGTKEKNGITVPDSKNKLGETIYGSNFGSVGRSYVVVESISADEVKVIEMATDNSTNLYVTPAAPSVREVAAGDSFAVGGARVEILTITKDSVKVRISDSQGSKEKVLGPYNEKTMQWVPLSMTACDPFWVLSGDGKSALHLNVFKDGGPFAAGKASLVAYSDVIDIRNLSVWDADPRFLALAET